MRDLVALVVRVMRSCGLYPFGEFLDRNANEQRGHLVGRPVRLRVMRLNNAVELAVVLYKHSREILHAAAVEGAVADDTTEIRSRMRRA